MTTAVRLDDTLVRHAAAEGAVHRRSTPKQIEYWAEIGRAVAGDVSAEDLIAILQGIGQVANWSALSAAGVRCIRRLERNRAIWKPYIRMAPGKSVSFAMDALRH